MRIAGSKYPHTYTCTCLSYPILWYIVHLHWSVSSTTPHYNSGYSAIIDNVPRQTYNIPCLLHFMFLVSRVTLDVLNVETSVRFYLVLSIFTFDTVGSFDYSNTPLTNARTVSVLFAMALILLKPIASSVLLEYSATAHCWISCLLSQVCHNTAVEMWWLVWLMYWCRKSSIHQAFVPGVDIHWSETSCK